MKTASRTYDARRSLCRVAHLFYVMGMAVAGGRYYRMALAFAVNMCANSADVVNAGQVFWEGLKRYGDAT